MAVKPISPTEALERKEKIIPDAVFEAFNELLTDRIGQSRIVIYQEEVVDLIASKGIEKEEIFRRKWLDVEDYYRQLGWNVEYDKPGFNESYAAYFAFTRK